VHY
jgi:estrogen-related receptor beta like 1